MAISSVLDLRLTLDILLDHTLAQLGVDAANILLYNPHTQMLEYGVGRGFRSKAQTQLSLRMGESQAGRAALERRMVAIPDIQASEAAFSQPHLLADEGFSAYYAVPLITKGQIKGVLKIFHRSTLNPDAEWFNFLETLAGQAAIAIDNAQLFDYLQRANADLSLAYDSTIEGWAGALELRDEETEGHSQRVTKLTLQLARAMGVNDAEMAHLRRGALLHDIGKMGVPDDILRKPGPLTDEEWVIMRQHPQFAFDMLAPITYLKPALDIPYCHHEKWDGSGYPRGLKGEQIPLAARVFAVVDVWDALLSDRPYRKAWSQDRTMKYIRKQAGKHFDPKVGEAFLLTGDKIS
ncbi:MAG: HD domain-containing phosphohydrolase [Chloroflexota bacterium]